MSLSKLFQRIIWHNNTTPAINEDNLNAMSKAIDDIDDRVILIGDDVVTVIPQIQAYLEQAEDLVEAMEELSQNPPYIGANGNWYVFDTTLEAYKDSGVDASITVDIADITMIAEGAQPYVTNSGTNTDPVFHLFIPRGQTGTGITSIVKTASVGNVDTYTIMFSDGSTTTFDVTNGSGSGDMRTSVYDSDNAVANAGGIADYVEGEVAPMLNVLGAKNLLPNNAVAQTITGLTFVINSDGSITVNGTSTSAWSERITGMTLRKGKYILSDGGASIFGSIRLQVVNQAETVVIAHTSTSHEMEFELSADTFVYVRIFWATDITVSNLTFYPMIRLASIQDDTYVPYSMTNREMTPYVQAISNPNLLDNPWFTVNQRGASSYNGSVYTVDRWRRNADNSSGHTLTVGGVTLSLLKGDFFQSISTDALTFKSISYTVSAIIDGTLYSRTFTPYGDGNNHYLGGAIGLDNMTWNIIEHWGANVNLVGINNNSATTDHTVTAIKLELGTQSTLSHDTAPNYSQELLKCQRYFVRYISPDFFEGYTYDATTARFGLVLPVPMRISPSFSVDDITHLQVIGNGSGQALTTSQTISNSGFGTNKKVMEISGLATALSANIPVSVKLNSGYIDLSADL